MVWDAIHTLMVGERRNLRPKGTMKKLGVNVRVRRSVQRSIFPSWERITSLGSMNFVMVNKFRAILVKTLHVRPDLTMRRQKRGGQIHHVKNKKRKQNDRQKTSRRRAILLEYTAIEGGTRTISNNESSSHRIDLLELILLSLSLTLSLMIHACLFVFASISLVSLRPFPLFSDDRV